MTSPIPASTQANPAADTESSSAPISPQRRNLIFVAIVLGMLLAALDQTIVATAILGCHQLSAGVDDRHRAGRQAR
jgi:hypothetical protein